MSLLRSRVGQEGRKSEFRGADTLQSFSMFAGLFYFGSSHLFQLIFVNEPNERKQTFLLRQTFLKSS